MDIIGKGKWFALVSFIAMAASVVMLFTPGLKLGIDFKAGTTITYRLEGMEDETATIREAIAGAGHDEAVVQSLGEGEYLVRLSDLRAEGEKEDIDAAVEAAVGAEPETLDVTTVGKSVAEGTVRNAITAVVVASVAIMIYIFYAFRSVKHSYRYSLVAIVALVHDVLITLGVFTVMGQLIGAEVNAIFIVGILTIIGYSVNDTIVIFDRIRENSQVAPNRPFRNTVNLSIRETMTRSLATSITVGTVVLAMLLFGGDTLRDFFICLMAGVVAGAYSSVFVAAWILVVWEDGSMGRVLGLPFRRFRRQPEPA